MEVALARLVGDVCQRLSSENEDERLDALQHLDELLEDCFGEDGARLGTVVRNSTAIEALLSMVKSEDADVAVQALHVIANLVSDAVDPSSTLTKHALLKLENAGRTVVNLLKDDDSDKVFPASKMLCPAQLLNFIRLAARHRATVLPPWQVMLAIGTIQNLCATTGWSKLVVEEGMLPRIAELVVEGQCYTQRYAAGALKNIIRVAHADVDAGGNEAEWEAVWLSEVALDAVEARAKQARPPYPVPDPAPEPHVAPLDTRALLGRRRRSISSAARAL